MDLKPATTVTPIAEQPRLQHNFPEKWRALHCMCDPTIEKLLVFIAGLPLFGCSCKDEFAKLVKQIPPRFDDWQKWTFEAHNSVNERLGKKQFTWGQFEKKYPAWKQVDGHRIGFAAINYEEMGGTETFHQTIVQRLPNVIGFASQNELRGDIKKLGVPTGQGMDAIAALSLQCDTVISWNIDWTHNPKPKQLITVHHGSLPDTPSTQLCLQGDAIVCVNQDVANHLRTITDKPVYCIPNAVDPDRIKPRIQVETNGKKIVLWSHRFAKDKQPQLAIEIAKHLPDDWHMVLTGHRGEKLETHDRATILPPTHPGDWLSVASCFLSTSLFEGFGLSVAEAIVAGVPVVSTPVGIATRPGLASTLASDAKPEEWADAILASQSMALPIRDLFSVDKFLGHWGSLLSAF
jgi:glycosyltransferase involved in cell wall biosynthesis